MKNLMPLALVLTSLTFATACSDKGSSANSTTTPPTAGNDSTAHATGAAPDAMAVVYTCEMHPEVRSDKPGACPKCGMDLIEKK